MSHVHLDLSVTRHDGLCTTCCGTGTRSDTDNLRLIPTGPSTACSTCCDSHNQTCEPPSELCCTNCTEATHDTFPIRHADGSRCVLDAQAKTRETT